MTAVEFSEVSLSFGDTPIFSGLSFSVQAGQCVGLAGANGAGKSSVCHIIAGLIPRLIKGVLTGGISLFGQKIDHLTAAERTALVGMVFQNPDNTLFLPTVEDELAFAPENLCLARDEIERRITSVLHVLGIGELRYKNPALLSGGQKQLVALGCVLTQSPRLLILDEVNAQLDSDARARVRAVIGKLVREGLTVIMVEHEMENLEGLVTRIIRI